MRKSFKSALERAYLGKPLSREELVTLLEIQDKEERNALFSRADQIRRRYVGDEVHFRGIVEFSNHCIKNCHYCGLRRGNRQLKRYRMTPEEIINTCKTAVASGFKTIVLQSGEDPNYSAETLADLIHYIKSKHQIAVTLSLGEKPQNFYRLLKDAGADRYLLKHETADPELFSRLRPGTNLSQRLECLKSLKKLGYQVGSGNIVGLPGQSINTLAEDILLMQELEVDMAGIGPFIPSENTPLAQCAQGDLFLTLKVLAVTRLALPWANLPATTAVGTIHPQGRKLALECGANVIMPNVTPPELKKHYRIYPGKEKFSGNTVEKLKKLVHSLGRRISDSKGDVVPKLLRKGSFSNV